MDGAIAIEIYNRDEDQLPEILSGCIVYWKKGCAGSEFYKGEIFGTNQEEIATHCDESLGGLIARLRDEVTLCVFCGHIVDIEEVNEDNICEDCYYETPVIDENDENNDGDIGEIYFVI